MEQKIYHLFLDDMRVPKDVTWIELPLVHWVIVRNYSDFVRTIEHDGLPQSVTFDHDIADEHYKEYVAAHDEKNINKGKFQYDKMKEKTGYECAKFMVNYCVDKGLPIPVYYVHTLNPIGYENIISILESARKMINKK